MAKLLFLGTGSNLTLDTSNFQSNFLLIANSGRKMLIDCGTDIRHSLAAQGYSYTDIDDIYISHLHSDHVGGLEWLGLSTFYRSDGRRPNLYAHRDVIDGLWENVLSGGMGIAEGQQASLDTYFNVQKLDTHSNFKWEELHIQIFQTIHIIAEQDQMPSYGLKLNSETKHVLITTDTQYDEQHLMPLYESCDNIFHDCETAETPSTVHAHYNELKELPSAIKNKMWLYHYDHASSNLPDAKKDGFCGFVSKGQVFNLSSGTFCDDN